MAVNYIPICENETAEVIELPLEQDGTLLLSTLTGQFDSALGLKYRHPDSKAMRGIRLADGKLHPPTSDGWVDEAYICVFPKENKRKSEDELTENSTPTKKRADAKRCVDLIVLGLSFKATDHDLREYFETFGEVLMANVKKDSRTGEHKGYGFIRVASYDVQTKILSQRHMIEGRMCDVKVPGPKENNTPTPNKIYVGRCTEDITADDLRTYFSKFGIVTDVYIPNPHRAFSFVTFADPDVAQSLYGEDHIIKGHSVHITSPAVKKPTNSPIVKEQPVKENEVPNKGNFVTGAPIKAINSNGAAKVPTYNNASSGLFANALQEAGWTYDNVARSQNPMQDALQRYKEHYNARMAMDYAMGGQYMQQPPPQPPAHNLGYGNWVASSDPNHQKYNPNYPSRISA